MIEIQNDCQAGKEKEQTHNPGILLVFAEVPESADDSENKRKEVETVISFALHFAFRKTILTTYQHIVDKFYPTDPVSMNVIPMPLFVILPPNKVPGKITGVHEAGLIADQETDIIQECRRLGFRHAHPVAVIRNVLRVIAIHSWEKGIAIVNPAKFTTRLLVLIFAFTVNHIALFIVNRLRIKILAVH